MAKIVSRLTGEQTQLERLREILDLATAGAIAPGSTLEPADDLEGLVTQTDIACASLLETLNRVSLDLEQIQVDRSYLEMFISRQKDYFKPIKTAVDDGVTYDEDLEHATIDTMEALLATGAFETTFNGEIALQDGAFLTKEDFKPIVRQAIDSWLRLKLVA